MARRVRLHLSEGPASLSCGGVTVVKGKPVETDDPEVIRLFEVTGLVRITELDQPKQEVKAHPKDAPRNEPGPVASDLDPAYEDHDDSDLPPAPLPAEEEPPAPKDDGMKAARKRQGKKPRKASDLG